MLEVDFYNRIQDPLDAIERLGNMFAKSGMFGCTRTEQGAVMAMICIVKKMSPTELLAKYDIIDGKLRKKSLACLAEFRQKGGKHVWLETGDDGLRAVGQFTFEGNTYKVTFTLDDAKRQGLVRPNSNWVKTPANMLRARVISNAIGMLAPEIVAEGDETEEPPPAAVTLNLLPEGQTATATTHPAPAAIEEKIKKPEPVVTMVDPVADEPIPPPKPVQTIEPELNAPAVATKEDDIPFTFPKVTPVPAPEEDAPQDPFDEPPPKKHHPLVPVDQLPPETVEDMGKIFQGNFLKVANWMIKEGWICPADRPLSTEAQAAFHLQQTLPLLSKPRAKRVLAKKMAFMRAVEEIRP